MGLDIQMNFHVAILIIIAYLIGITTAFLIPEEKIKAFFKRAPKRCGILYRTKHTRIQVFCALEIRHKGPHSQEGATK